MIGNASYCPILHTRTAEMRALLQLPTVTKDGMFPVIVGRPWPNAKRLINAWNKVTESVEGRRYALDLDRTRDGAVGNHPAHAEFNALFSANDGYINYYGALDTLPNAVPVLRLGDVGSREFFRQADHIHRLDRGLVVRLELNYIQNPMAVVDYVYRELQAGNDVTFVIDAGWSPQDLLTHELRAAPIIRRITELQPEAEIVIAGSSFPDQFANQGVRFATSVAERRLYSALKRRFNAANLIYGDWGSTRPPRESTPMTSVPRIDLPTPNEWISFRQDKDPTSDYGFNAIARRVTRDVAWPRDLDIWGTYMINSTAEDLPEGIKSPTTAAAARMNIHLHRQTFFDVPNVTSDRDEPYTDIF